MATSNSALVPDPDKQDDLASKFWQWPILNVGLRMCSWDDAVTKYFLLGNPAVYWGSTAALGLLGLTVAWYLVRFQRGYDDLKQGEIDYIHYAALYPALGWFLHYLPFVIMARVTYVHHYYPALYYAILSFGFIVDWFTRPIHRKNKTLEWAIYSGLYITVAGLFVYFAPIVFGMTGANTSYKYMKWFSKWRVTD